MTGGMLGSTIREIQAGIYNDWPVTPGAGGQWPHVECHGPLWRGPGRADGCGRFVMDFVDFRPDEHGDPFNDVLTRRSTVEDAHDLAAVMAARGGAAADHLSSVGRLIATAPIVLVAQRTHGDVRSIIGWSGAVRIPLRPGSHFDWVIAGLTVLPSWRRQGVGARLLRDVMTAISSEAPGSVVHSIVNAQNRASLLLHARAGFEETARGESFAGVVFEGGAGVLLTRTAR